mmetsp:Transcript_135291/g.431980  ORF Transcript_135291/g.431980 Transcript_135291/m.431980 type:complete len:213 (+) Transcript_135291:2976-3614(+)
MSQDDGRLALSQSHAIFWWKLAAVVAFRTHPAEVALEMVVIKSFICQLVRLAVSSTCRRWSSACNVGCQTALSATSKLPSNSGIRLMRWGGKAMKRESGAHHVQSTLYFRLFTICSWAATPTTSLATRMPERANPLYTFLAKLQSSSSTGTHSDSQPSPSEAQAGANHQEPLQTHPRSLRFCIHSWMVALVLLQLVMVPETPSRISVSGLSK